MENVANASYIPASHRHPGHRRPKTMGESLKLFPVVVDRSLKLEVNSGTPDRLQLLGNGSWAAGLLGPPASGSRPFGHSGSFILPWLTDSGSDSEARAGSGRDQTRSKRQSNSPPSTLPFPSSHIPHSHLISSTSGRPVASSHRLNCHALLPVCPCRFRIRCHSQTQQRKGAARRDMTRHDGRFRVRDGPGRSFFMRR